MSCALHNNDGREEDREVWVSSEGGETEAGPRQATQLKSHGRPGAQPGLEPRLLSWCPTCSILRVHMGAKFQLGTIQSPHNPPRNLKLNALWVPPHLPHPPPWGTLALPWLLGPDVCFPRMSLTRSLRDSVPIDLAVYLSCRALQHGSSASLHSLDNLSHP